MFSLSDRVLSNVPVSTMLLRKPPWLRAKLPGGQGYQHLRRIIDQHHLHTVCESAKCPNMGQCWARGTATLMILGNVCTRSCGFCHIKTGRPVALDTDEPLRVGQAVALMRLSHVVVTSVNRDELADGGADIWAETIKQIRKQSPRTSVEVLIGDFCGNWSALQRVVDERPDILNHNMETVRRLYPRVRPQAKYDRSLELLRRCKDQGLRTKTGIMVGIGEHDQEIHELMWDVTAQAGTDLLTIGQYLQPTLNHLPIHRWVSPQQFAAFKRHGETVGFRHVESGPLVRSSYHAEEQVVHLEETAAFARCASS